MPEQDRRSMRRQIEQAYKEYVPPQVRQLRQGRWFGRVNPNPQVVVIPWRPMGRYRSGPNQE